MLARTLESRRYVKERLSYQQLDCLTVTMSYSTGKKHALSAQPHIVCESEPELDFGNHLTSFMPINVYLLILSLVVSKSLFGLKCILTLPEVESTDGSGSRFNSELMCNPSSNAESLYFNQPVVENCSNCRFSFLILRYTVAHKEGLAFGQIVVQAFECTPNACFCGVLVTLCTVNIAHSRRTKKEREERGCKSGGPIRGVGPHSRLNSAEWTRSSNGFLERL